MTRNFVWLPVASFLAGVNLLAGTPAFASPSRTVPPASFIDYHVSTVKDLTQEVTIDPAVCKRLTWHFHITRTQLVTYVRQNLVLRRLDTSGNYRVACVRPNGSEYWITAHLRAGTSVFASRATGQPVLKLACGNPMVSALPMLSTKSSFNGTIPPPQLAPIPSEERIAALPSLTLSPDDAEFPDDIASSDLEVPPVVMVGGSLESFVSAVKPISSSGSFNFLPALAGIGAAVGIFHQNPSHSTVTASPVTPSPAVPEASTLVSLGLMLLAGGLIIHRQRYANRNTRKVA